MKREWKKPELEMLDIKMTFHNVNGRVYDADWSEETEIPVDENGDHLDAKS
ncbi:paeninodin family lasso peptide [Bacillus sp. ISL-41]|uniref:paeninodin family lasso peptide n=1 Tax=Bacillus sp. ISL-41 TaxID=2819127 RepID=UPI001BEBAAEC|nr:paeninodin family lasso peptide [Bacillus sp. ISL-41]MBT2642180.1 paeninodin family lasso peptide [Bacillus sp. ISL-41]